MKVLTISQDDFKKGLYALDDDSKAPFGSARKMLNVLISDRGGVTSRPGTQLLGNFNSSSAVRGLYNFRKSLSEGNKEILLKSYSSELEFYDTDRASFYRLKNGFTPDKEFGFSYSLVNTDNEDYAYYCNRYEEFQRWRGATTHLTSALVGAETSLPVTSILKDAIYLTETATSNSATTLTVSGAVWATDMWKNFYIYIPSTGKVRLISGNTSDTITFATLGSGPGNVAFQVRQLAFPPTGSVIYNGTIIAYTTPDVATALPVASAHAASSGEPVALIPETFISAPRGNRMDSLLGRLIVGNVRQAISRDVSGNLQGSAQTGSLFVSKLLDPSSFTFAATRVAGEGDILNVAYGGGEITDVKAQEDTAYIYKRDYIEAVKYSGDQDDVAIRTPLKTGVGSVGRVIKGRDDHYFITKDKQYTSIGRVRTRDILPQTDNFGMSIKRILDSYGHDEFTGFEFGDRIISSHKSDENLDYNNIMLVYNRKNRAFEGIWSLGANAYEVFQDELIYGESSGANAWKMFQTRKADVIDADTELPYTAIWQSNFFNLLPIKSNIQGINSVALEGFITANTTFTFSLYKDFSEIPTISFDFGGLNDQDFMNIPTLGSFLGQNPLGLQPLGTISDPDSDGRRRFSFIVYFPYVYGQYFSTALQSDGIAQDWEVIRMSAGLKESISTRVIATKEL